MEGPDSGRCGGIGSVEGDWHHHVDELAICFQDPGFWGPFRLRVISGESMILRASVRYPGLNPMANSSPS